MADVKLLITGGTIDKIYNEINGSLSFDETHIPAMLEQSRSKVEIGVEMIM